MNSIDSCPKLRATPQVFALLAALLALPVAEIRAPAEPAKDTPKDIGATNILGVLQ